jgi:putative thioredoxin
MIDLGNTPENTTGVTENILDITADNFQQALIEESHKRLVVVDFWADWCAPCKALMPILEKLANEYQGQILLAKVNCDEQQALAAQFGVRSLPTVAVMKDGQPVDGFMGAQPESEIRQMLEKHLPQEHEVAFQQAQELIQQGDITSAATFLQAAHNAAPERSDIALTLADVLIELKRLEEAEKIIAAIPLQDQDSHFSHVKAKLELALEASDSPELSALEQKLSNDPDNAELAIELSIQYQQAGRNEDALTLLMNLLRKDLNAGDGAVKKAMTDILSALETSNPLVVKFQRKLYSLLY